MEATTTSETFYRATFLHDGKDVRSTLRGRFVSADEAWDSIDKVDVSSAEGHWIVEQVTTTTTTTEVTR